MAPFGDFFRGQNGTRPQLIAGLATPFGHWRALPKGEDFFDGSGLSFDQLALGKRPNPSASSAQSPRFTDITMIPWTTTASGCQSNFQSSLLILLGTVYSCNGNTSHLHPFTQFSRVFTAAWGSGCPQLRTKSAIFAWLQEVSYPPVNHLPQFAPTKFLPETQ